MHTVTLEAKTLFLQSILADSSLPATAKVVAAVLLNAFNCKTHKCCPRISTVARLSGCGDRSAQDAIGKLVDAGYVTVRRHRGPSDYSFPALFDDMQKAAHHLGQDVQESAHLDVQESAGLDTQKHATLNPGRLNREKETKRERGGDARASIGKSGLSPAAYTLANDFLVAIGVDPQNPELYGMAGAPYAAQMWLTRGYERPLILATAADRAARYGPNKPIGFYTKCFETAHRDRPAAGQRNLPLLQAIEGNNHATPADVSRSCSHAADLLHPAVRTTSFTTFAADLRARIKDDHAA
jgi:Helix-turn-helix domain